MTRLLPAYDKAYDEGLIDRIMARHGVPRLLARALIRRNLTGDGEIRAFLRPEEQPLPDPWLYPEMGKAVSRIRQAILSDERICIYGDYDADGICAAVILMRCLSELSELVSYYIPSRRLDGYGLNEGAIDALAAEGVSLIITVDNGIAAGKEVAYCAGLGIDVVVTDHHLRKDAVPDCTALLSGADTEDSPCGALVALQLARALRPDRDISGLLPLAAIATVADIVPMIGMNRTVVKLGLPLIQNNLGLRALLTQADMLTKPVSEETVSFFIAPRLNAAGRVGNARRAAELLLAERLTDALALSDELEEDNKKRRALENETLLAAKPLLDETLRADDGAAVVSGEGWNVGVVGIVASKLAEQTCLPTLVFAEEEEGLLTGSGRSVPGVDLFSALSEFSSCFLRFGGHEMAAGVTMEKEKLPAFREAFSAYLWQRYPKEVFEKSSRYEETLPLSELTLENAGALALLSPFGEGNREPLLLFQNALIANARSMGKDKSHLSFELVQGEQVRRGVFFGAGRLSGLLSLGGGYDVLGSMSVNTFNGVSTPELAVKTVQRHDAAEQKIVLAIFTNLLYNDEVCSEFAGDGLRSLPDCSGAAEGLSHGRMQLYYAAIRSCLSGAQTRVTELLPLLTPSCAYALMVFIELGFFAWDGRRQSLAPAARYQPRALSESALYRRLTKE